nr:hypothetical protein [Tanacetum cinerariifolium]
MLVAQQVDESAAEVNVDDVPAAGVADEGAADVNVDVVLTAVDEPSIPSPTPPTQSPPPSQDQPSTSQDAKMSMDLLHTLMETYTSLKRIVKQLEQDKIAQAVGITKLKQRVKKLERRNKLEVSKLKRLKKVGTSQRIDTFDDTVMDDEVAVDAEIKESADVQGRQVESQAQIYQIDLEHADKVLSMQDDEVEPSELQEVVEVVTTAKLITEVVTAASATITAAAPTLTTATPTLTTAPSAARRRNEVVIRDPEEIATPSIIIYFEAKSKYKRKGILVEEPKPLKKQAQIEQDKAFSKPQTKAQARKNMMIYLRNMAGLKIDYFKGMNYDDIRLIFKKKFNSNKLDEEVAELKRRLQIMLNDDDDVYTEATPLSHK